MYICSLRGLNLQLLLKDKCLTQSLSRTLTIPFFLTLSYLPNWGILIIQDLLNGRASFHPELPVLSQFSASLVKLTSNGGIYLPGLLVEAPLESWRCSLWILCIIVCFFANWLLWWSYRISSCYFTLEEGAQRRNRKPAGMSLILLNWFWRLILSFLLCWIVPLWRHIYLDSTCNCSCQWALDLSQAWKPWTLVFNRTQFLFFKNTTNASDWENDSIGEKDGLTCKAEKMVFRRLLFMRST